jgi:thiol:disulfide interchange protein DsbA
MGILEKSHQAIFDALHKQHKPLRSIEDVAAWYASEFGIDRDKFLSIANSFMVDSMIKKGDDIAIAMKVPNTPKLVVNGKYMPEIMGLKSNEAVIEATRYFIKQEAKRMGLVE